MSAAERPGCNIFKCLLHVREVSRSRRALGDILYPPPPFFKEILDWQQRQNCEKWRRKELDHGLERPELEGGISKDFRGGQYVFDQHTHHVVIKDMSRII